MRKGTITGSDHNVTPDNLDEDLLTQRVYEWDNRQGPRVGDFIEFSDGVTHRFSHDHGEGWGIQTSPLGGSFYITDTGHMSYSGGLEPCIKHHLLTDTEETRAGVVWFFHHDDRRASNAVLAQIPCRVFKTDATSDHWKLTGRGPA